MIQVVSTKSRLRTMGTATRASSGAARAGRMEHRCCIWYCCPWTVVYTGVSCFFSGLYRRAMYDNYRNLHSPGMHMAPTNPQPVQFDNSFYGSSIWGEVTRLQFKQHQ